MAPELARKVGRQVVIEPGGKVVVTDTRTGITTPVNEDAAPRGRKEPSPSRYVFPPGTIESVRPLLKDVYQVVGVERDESYWLTIDEASVFSVKDAWRKIRQANKGRGGIAFETVARATLETDGLLNESRERQKLSPEGYSALVSLLAAKILAETRKKGNVSLR